MARPNPVILTVSEAAVALRLSEQRIRQLLLAGRIVGARRLGRDWAIPAPARVSEPTSRSPGSRARSVPLP